MGKIYDNNTQILAELIDTLRAAGVKVESPYDFENWIDDNASHSQMFETGRFAHLQNED